MFKQSLVALAAGVFAMMPPVLAQTPATPIVDYNDGNNWLCRPGEDDACAEDLTATVVSGSGKTRVEKFKVNRRAEIDCFYVYPTVSLDATPNSDMLAGPEERNVAISQFARFGSHCRTFAPLYRQITLTALRANMSGKPSVAADRNLGYNDVLNAWKHYLANDNKGRGFILIGHSQGAGVLTQLIRNEIDGKPIQQQLVSAILMGTNLPVPKNADVGGAFKSIPLCKSDTQLGCVIAYASFRATQPPPADTLFGRVPGEGMVAACTNPAVLSGGKSLLSPYMSTRARDGEPATAWLKDETIDTPFVSLPAFLTGECVSNDKGSYLAVTVHDDPLDPRTDDIGGDVISNGQIQANWGLHLVDANLVMGNLLDVVTAQARTYKAKK